MKKLSIVSCTMLLCGLMFAQDLPFRIEADFAKYRGDDQHLYLEVYYTFDVSKLRYVKKDASFQSEVVVSVWFKRLNDDSVAARQSWRIPFTTADTSVLQSSRSYSDVFGFYLKPEVYKVYVTAKDVNEPAVNDSFSVVLDIKQITTETIALSDIELCTSINPIEKDSTNRFYKNTFEVKPNPAKIFGLHQPVLFYYLEAYNLKKKQSEFYHTKAIVTNALGNEVINHEKSKRRVNDSNVEVGMIKVNSLRTGAYVFTYVIVDSVDKTSYSSSKRFFIYNPSLPNDTLTNKLSGSVDATEYATMNEQELDKEFELSRYVAQKNEIDQYRSLKGVEAKRKSLYNFWSSRDEDATTSVNETKQEYFRRLAIANSQYKTGFREGWKTDRGRIFIIYGQPDEIERHANEVDVKPYEIWFYGAIQGGVQFIFGDRTGFSDYILLHSNHQNELHDENWRRQIGAN